jgi:hypothetical protein
MLETDPTAGIADETHEADLDDALVAEAIDQAEAAQTRGAAAVEDETASSQDGAGETTEIAAAETIEPTAVGDLDVGVLDALGVRPLPARPIPKVKRRVAGSYRSSGTPFQVELRVDVDGTRPTRRVSADYYFVSGATISYFGSMRVDIATITVSPTMVTITGLGSYTWAAGAPKVKIMIPRVGVTSPPSAATLQHLTTGGAPGATYICRWASPYFRSVLFEQDRQDSVAAPFASYNTGSLPSGGPARTLSVAAAYAEAGIQLQSGGTTDVINTSEAGGGGMWSDAELHAAMVSHFSLWRDVPQWAIWLFHAQLHDLGPNLLGIMFDQQGRQRQGAASFYQSLAGATPDRQRLQLYTCTHELGHCFNLLHSWQKSLASPPGTDRPAALSWMNYPQRFPGGAGSFWSAFPFQFDDPELVHLRHAFRDNIILGGKPFTVGSALEDPEQWRTPIADTSGLMLELIAPKSFAFGAPVSVDIRLSSTDQRGRRVYEHLRPRNGTVEIAIRKPSDRTVVYRPLLHHCTADDTVILDQDRPSISESAFIGYGKDGFYFDQPGFYELRARYAAPDGSLVLSNTITIRVQGPVSEEDNAVADLVFGDDQGTLFYLVGSDFEGLQSGNDALSELIERYPDHPVTAFARVVQGVNAAREFKLVSADNAVTVRAADKKEATKLLGKVIDLDPLETAAQEQEEAATEKEGIQEVAMAAAAELRTQTEEPDIPDDVSTYIRARRREIATEVVSQAR